MNTPSLRPDLSPASDDGSNDWSADTPVAPPYRSKLRVHIILFLLTLLTTLMAGAMSPLGYDLTAIIYLIANPVLFLHGAPYALSLLAILTAHEMGHYVLSRRHGVVTSLPYFLPSPISFGTFGAVIVTRSLYPNRRALMDIGAAGPIAGFLVALPITAIGISMSTVQALPTDGTPYVGMGDPLILKLLTYLIIGPLPEGHDVFVHPVAFAGWFGFLVTMLNLIPVSQLDGGHILYALSGRSPSSQRLQLGMTIASFAVMGYLGMSFLGWYVWAGLLFIMSISFRFRHPPSLDDTTPLDLKRKIIGLIAIVILVVTFIPVPFTLPGM